MSDSDSTISDHKGIDGFTKGKGLYCLKPREPMDWLVTKGALGRARRELLEREKDTDGRRTRHSDG